MNKIQLYLFSIFILLSTSIFSQTLSFAKKAGGNSPGNGEQANRIATDDLGNTYITGYVIAGTSGAIFGAGEANETVLNGNGLFIAKYDNDGLLLWVKSAGNTGNNIIGNAIDIDNDGNVYVAGRFYNEAIFDSGGSNQTTVSGTLGETFIAKYDADGEFIWVKSFGGEFDDSGAFDLIFNGTDEIIITGSFTGNTTFGQNQTGDVTLTAINSDIYLVKFYTDGTFFWARKAGGDGNEGGKNLAIDADKNIYLTGNYLQRATFGLGETNEIELNGANETAFIAKYLPTGNLIWAMNPYISSGADISGDLKVNSLGEIFYTGGFAGEIELGANTANSEIITSAGADEILVAKFNTNGGYLWSKSAMSSMNDRGVALDIDAQSNVYITGYYGANATFGSGEVTEVTLTNIGSSDLFLAKYSNVGNFSWATSATGMGWQQGTDIAINSSGEVFVTGFYFDDVTFGSGETNETFLSVSGQSDIFIAKFNSQDTLLDVIASGLNNPLGIDLYGNELFVAESGSNRIVKIDLSQNNPVVEEVIGSLNYPTDVLIIGNNLYYLELLSGSVSKLDLTQSSPTPEFIVDGFGEPGSIAIHNNILYVSESINHRISKVNLSSSNPTRQDAFTGVVPLGIKINQDILYVADTNDDKIYTADLTQTTPVLTELGVSNLLEPLDFFFQDNFLYVSQTDGSSNKLSRVDLNTLSTEDIIELNGYNVYSITGVDNFIYISEPNSGHISRINLNVLSTESYEEVDNVKHLAYPNPTKGKINFTGDFIRKEFIVVNLLGKEVMGGTISETNQIDLSTLETGLYYVVFENGLRKKVIKID